MPINSNWSGIELTEHDTRNYVQMGVRTETNTTPTGWAIHYWVSGKIDGTWFAEFFDSDYTVDNKTSAYAKFSAVEKTLLKVTA